MMNSKPHTKPLFPLPVQLHQILNLFLLLLLAKYTAYLYYGWGEILTTLFVTLLATYALERYYRHIDGYYIPYSALTTALGVLLMSFSTHLWMTITVIIIALFQKYILRINDRHLFNPSNFALIFGLLCFYADFHIVLGQLGDSHILAGVVLLLGALILYRIDRWIIPLAFTFAYLLLQYAIIVQSDPVIEMESIWLRFYSVSFILFILFMLTDPKTTPKSSLSQMLFAILIALGATWLDYQNGFRVQHLFMALFVVSAAVPLLQYKNIEKKQRYLLWLVLVLAMGAIILIEQRPPYYFAMDV